jgi:hypothetical protein
MDNHKAFVAALSLAILGLPIGVSPVSAQAGPPPGPPLGPISLPNLVIEPQGMNFGGTSFYDGFAPPIPGIVYTQTDRVAFDNRVVDANGHDVTAFKNPRLTTEVSVNQLLFTSPVHVGPTLLGFDVIVPLVNTSTHFDTPGLVLHSSGPGVGDVIFGPYLQSIPIMQDGHPLFAYTLEVDGIAPTGKFDANKDINPSSGFWSFNPNLAMTWFFAPRWELATRLNYVYNFQTNKIPNPPPIPFLTYRDGQAGQMAWINFAASYGVTPQLDIGVNGFYVKQLTDNKLNGVTLKDTREEQLYAGPGLRYAFNQTNYVNVNAYIPAVARNVSEGFQLNVEFIHVF